MKTPLQIIQELIKNYENSKRLREGLRKNGQDGQTFTFNNIRFPIEDYFKKDIILAIDIFENELRNMLQLTFNEDCPCCYANKGDYLIRIDKLKQAIELGKRSLENGK